MATSLPTVQIALETECEPGCRALAEKTYTQLSGGGYTTPCSVLRVPDSPDDWLSVRKTARKRANACEREGFEFRDIERADWEQDIYRINVSLPERQGRQMAKGYREFQSFGRLGPQPCSRHRISEHGVVGPSGHLVAYLVMYRVGALALVSQLLGHGEYLEAGTMYLLFRGALEAQIEQGGYAWYNRHDSGTEGLRFYKERLGFSAMTVEWLP